jgi:3-oxosteroid 1-dehydrogenase
MSMSSDAGQSTRVQSAWEADLVVVGSGAAGFAAAITARRRGLSVIVLEKRPTVGGTTARSGTWIWAPHHHLMREAGVADPKDGALRYMARLSFSESYDPGAADLGIGEPAHAMLSAFYDNAGDALKELTEAGAVDPVMRRDIPDYFAELPENEAPYGRVIVSRGRKRPDQLTGAEFVDDLHSTALRLGVTVVTGFRVTDVDATAAGEVTGVIGTVDGRVERVRAHRGVVFCTGGFTHAPDLMRDYFSAPLAYGGASRGSEGDFLRIAQGLGARLHNVGSAWLAPIPIEPLLRDPEAFTTNIFALRGDSMILVNRHGERTMNEKLPYHELAGGMMQWDSTRVEYPNLRMFMVFDSDARRYFADGTSGNPIPPIGADDGFLVAGDTIEDLATHLAARLDSLSAAARGGTHLSPDFASNLTSAIRRFNELAASGSDVDLHRGRSPIELYRNGPARPGNDKNPALYPLSDSGPYYALILAPGTLDTKGGPAIDPDARVLDRHSSPIPGLYAAGNCAGFPSGPAYWAGGATIGLAITFGYLAALHAAGRPR